MGFSLQALLARLTGSARTSSANAAAAASGSSERNGDPLQVSLVTHKKKNRKRRERVRSSAPERAIDTASRSSEADPGDKTAEAGGKRRRKQQARTDPEEKVEEQQDRQDRQERRAARIAKRTAKAAARRAGRTFNVVSFPKSGRTWLRVMLDGLKLDAKYTHDGSGHSKSGQIEEIEPASDSFSGKTIVFLFRDPRDTVVSGYFQTAKRLGGYEGTISEFVRDPRHGIEKIVRFNMEWLARGPQLGRFHSVTYEELKIDTSAALASIITFAGTDRSADEIALVVEEASFEKMQDRERSGELAERYGRILAPADAADPQSFKVREGIVGGFRKHLSVDDVEYCNSVIQKLGYPLDRHGTQNA